jgi:hypothetical protein
MEGMEVGRVYSRRSRKRDDVAAESANTSNTQLGDRDAFTIRYIRQTFHELQIVTNIHNAYHLWIAARMPEALLQSPPWRQA